MTRCPVAASTHSVAVWENAVGPGALVAGMSAAKARELAREKVRSSAAKVGAMGWAATGRQPDGADGLNGSGDCFFGVMSLLICAQSTGGGRDVKLRRRLQGETKVERRRETCHNGFR